MTSQSVTLDFGMKFIDVVTKTQQKNLQFYFGFSPKQESLKTIIVFQDAKGSFHLDGAVHPVSDSCFAHDIFIRYLSLSNQVFGYMQPFVSFCLCIFIFIPAFITVNTFIYGYFRFVSVFASLFLHIQGIQDFSSMADIGITFCIIPHIFTFADILF